MTEPTPLQILIVEDDDDTSRMLTVLLRRRGHHTLRCDELEAASTVLSVRCFDLALIDLSLPDGTGIEAARIARSRIPKPYLVALTGWTEGPLRDAADPLFDEVMLKPMRPEQLDQVVAAARRANEAPAA